MGTQRKRVNCRGEACGNAEDLAECFDVFLQHVSRPNLADAQMQGREVHQVPGTQALQPYPRQRQAQPMPCNHNHGRGKHVRSEQTWINTSTNSSSVQVRHMLGDSTTSVSRPNRADAQLQGREVHQAPGTHALQPQPQAFPPPSARQRRAQPSESEASCATAEPQILWLQPVWESGVPLDHYSKEAKEALAGLLTRSPPDHYED